MHQTITPFLSSTNFFTTAPTFPTQIITLRQLHQSFPTENIPSLIATTPPASGSPEHQRLSLRNYRTRFHPAPFARIRHQKVLAAPLTARPRKPVRQTAALQIFPQVTLSVCRHRVCHPIRACIQPTRTPPRQPSLHTLLYHVLRHTPLWPPALIHRGPRHSVSNRCPSPGHASSHARNQGAS